ncbi:zinc finger BED domain-containing protein RICESLEEPER 2 [Tanacetum coccineum]
MDLDISDLELDVEKNADKRAKRKTTCSKRKALTKKKPKTEGQEQKTKLIVADSHTNDASGEGNSSSVATWKHDDERIKKALIKLFVVGELPFAFVKNEAFVKYTESLNGKFILPSRHKLSRDVSKFYLEERNKLKGFLSKATNTVHFTTDTWTSHCQRVNYMALTAHFIDEEWVMHKRIINFRSVNSHKGDDIGRKLLESVHEWGIKHVMTITVDNASLNDKALSFLIERLPNIYAGGKHFQIRCFAHILNLIVKRGLTELDDSIQRVTKTYSEILDIDTHLRKWQAKPAFRVMATKMRLKYKKYLGKLSETNDFMYFTVLLDPTIKSQLISHGFRKIIRYDITPENPMSNKDLEQMMLNMVDEVEERMGVLFEMYKERCGFDSSSSGLCESMEPEFTSPSHGDNDFLNDFYNGSDTSSIESETELQRLGEKVKKPINVDSLEDLFNDDEIVKDMEYELEKTSENDKGEQDME